MTVNAKTLVKDKFWILEENGQKLGTLQKKENNGWIFLGKQDARQVFDSPESLRQRFGIDIMAVENNVSKMKTPDDNNFEVHGYPATTFAYNPMFDVQKQLPVYTKTPKSKSQFCAGYYIICFEKGWRKAYCPKLITLQRYQYQGPMKTKLEMQQRLNNAVKEFQDTNKTN